MWKRFSILIILILAGLTLNTVVHAYLPKADLIKGSGPEVYILENGTRHWIPSIEIFNEFNFKWQNIKVFSDLTIESYPQDDDWRKYDDHPDGSLLKGSGSEVYLIELGKKRWIPSPSVFINNNFGWKYILEIDDDDLDDYDLGDYVVFNETNRYPDTTILEGPEQGDILETGEIEFRYSGSNPMGPVSDLDFETYLKGHDDDWSYSSSNYIKEYDLSDESNRSYSFYVRAKNKEGYYDPTPAIISFQLGVSSYYQKVKIDDIEYDEDDFKDDNIVLSNESNEIIDITGWTIQVKGNSLDVVQAVRRLKAPFTDATNVNIRLSPDDELIISAGLSPIGVNFLTNKCTGYLDQDNFNPSLDTNCPYPNESDYSYLNESCRDFIDDLDRCELPNYINDSAISLDSECTSFLNENLNYSHCYSEHNQDPDFYNDEWRMFLNRTSNDVFSNVSDTIILYDQNGLKVDEYFYD